MENKTSKNNLIDIIKILDDDALSRDELLQKLNIKPSTFYKHLDSLKKAGFEINRKKGIYELANFKKKIKFAKYEIEALTYLTILASTMLSKTKLLEFNKVVMEIIHFSDEKDYQEIKKLFNSYKMSILKSSYRKKVLSFNKIIENNENIKIITKQGKELEIKPTEIIWGNEGLQIKYKNANNKATTIKIDEIIKIVEKETEENLLPPKNETIFELNGKLAKSYLLKEDERIIDSTKDKIVIASANPDKNALFKRLLRYDILCKVILPKKHVQEFRKMIENSLANLNKIQDNN